MIFLSVCIVVKQSATTFATRKTPIPPDLTVIPQTKIILSQNMSCSFSQELVRKWHVPSPPDPLCPYSKCLPAGRLLAVDSPCTSPTRTTARSAVDRPWCPHLRGHTTRSQRVQEVKDRLNSLLASSVRLQAAGKAPDSTERSLRSRPRSLIAGSSLTAPLGHF